MTMNFSRRKFLGAAASAAIARPIAPLVTSYIDPRSIVAGTLALGTIPVDMIATTSIIQAQRLMRWHMLTIGEIAHAR